MKREQLQELLDLAEKRDEKVYDWLRWLVLLASGALTLLVSLGDKATPLQTVLPLMRVAWVGLGAGIVFGAFAIYTDVWMARKLVRRLWERLKRNPESDAPISISPPPLLVATEHACYISLLIAVIALVANELLKR